jgi:molybdopterin molybdotransferase
MITVTEAAQIINSVQANFGTELVDIGRCLGRVLAQNIVADRDFPPFDRVTMDGLALAFADIKNHTTFEILGTQYAGQAAISIKKPGTCVEIMTGAVLPHGTDTVIRYEDCTIANQTAQLNITPTKGQNIHRQGYDKQIGQLLIPAYTRIQPAHIAVLASVGAQRVCVHKPATVAIISSGNELVPINRLPLPQQIRRSNSYAIAALLQKYHAKTKLLHIADSLIGTQKALSKALEVNNIVIITGGVSMGKKDYLPQALANIGAQQLFYKVAQKPGKPLWFGVLGQKVIYALPGNPVSCFLNTVRYILPWLHLNLHGTQLAEQQAFAEADIEIGNSLTNFVPACIYEKNGLQYAAITAGHGSGDFSNLTTANAFLEIPQGAKLIEKGTLLKVWYF